MAYIDREAFKRKLIDEKSFFPAIVAKALEEMPTADVEEVRHGEWIIENSERDWKDKDTYRLSIKCSECGKVHFLGTTKYQNEYDKEKLKKLGNYGDYSFCGKCGAKMDGERKHA